MKKSRLKETREYLACALSMIKAYSPTKGYQRFIIGKKEMNISELKAHVEVCKKSLRKKLQ